MTTETPLAAELIDAAQARCDLYADDPRQDIKTDVMNAFFAGAAWASARSALAQEAVPTGFVMVPMEPTPEMIDAGCDVDARHMNTYGQELAVRYRCMLASAPQPQDTKDQI